MNWSDKANEIADEILNKMEGIYTHDEVKRALQSAAFQGMEYEFDIAVMSLLDKLNKDKQNETRTDNIRATTIEV